MREFFDRLIADGEAGIDRLIEEATQETLQLDFKRKEVDRNGEFSPNDRKILAEALSGFANSAGGLIVFGVNARKGQDQIDCAQSAHPINDIKRFFSEAKTEVGRLVQPRLDDVAIEFIPSGRIAEAGYLLVYVPRSERRPHRSEAKNQKGYYKRVGDSFFEMEHYDIEDAFSRKAVPEIELRLRYKTITRDGQGRETSGRLVLYLKNISNVTAHKPYFMLKSEHSVMSQLFRVEHYSLEDGWLVVSGGEMAAIHPGQERDVAKINIDFSNDNPMLVMGVPFHDWYICIDCQYGCEDRQGTKRTVTLNIHELARLSQA